MFKMVNPNGGELGLAEKYTDYEDLGAAIFKYAHWLSDINGVVKKHKIEGIHPSYAISIRGENKDRAQKLINDMAPHLPLDIFFYTVDKRNLFEVRGPSGGLINGFVCYLMGRQI